MTQEVLKLALEALQVATTPLAKDRQEVLRAITAIKEALAKEKALQALHNENERLGLYKDAYAQTEQEPVCPDCKAKVLYECVACSSNNYPPKTKQEPLTHCEAGPEYCPVCNTELNQEPAIYPEEAYEMGLEEIAFYTTPPQRTWVGLTDEERNVINLQNVYTYDMALAIEAKLREKNT